MDYPFSPTFLSLGIHGIHETLLLFGLPPFAALRMFFVSLHLFVGRMNRLTWYQPGEYMEDIIIQSGHVGIYDGDLKQVFFLCA